LAYPPPIRVNTNASHSLYQPKHAMGANERGGPLFLFGESPQMVGHALMSLDGPAKHSALSAPSLSSLSGSHIAVPVALRVVPVSPSPDLLKIAHSDETSYGWNPSSQTDWMSNLFNADLDRHDQYHLSPLGLGPEFAPNSKAGYRDGPGGSFAKRGVVDAPDPFRDREHQGLYRRDGPFGYDKNGRKLSRSGGKKVVDYDEDYAPNEYEGFAEETTERDLVVEGKYYGGGEKERLEQPGLKGPMKPPQHQPQYQHQGYYSQAYAGHAADGFGPDHEFQARQMDVKRSRLPAHAVSVLKEWFFKHSHSPYPTEEEKEKFTKELSLTILQVNNWFTNARRRLLPDRI
jgi:hypothetical protein